jgi:HlyD family secretion protein
MIKNSPWVGLGLFLASGCAVAGADAPMEFQGVVEFEELQLAFEFSGRLSRLWVERGDHVALGDRLAAIDDALAQATIEARRSETEAARARTQVTQAGSRPEEVRALRARIRAADASLRQLTENVRRESTLMKEGITPPARVEELSAELDRSTAERDALAQNLNLLVQGPRRSEVAALEFQADASEALLQAEQERAERFELHAPKDADVLDHHFEPGEVVAAGAPVLTLADTTRPFAEVFVAQAELSRVRLRGPALVRVDALREPLTGHVEYVARKTEFTPRFLFSERERSNLVVRVRVRIEDPERKLHAGLPARVEFVTPRAAAPEVPLEK